MKLLYVSPVSASFELENNESYFAPNLYDVYLNGKLVLKDVKTNTFSLYELTPNTEYEIKVNDSTLKFKTKGVSEIKTTCDIDKSGEINVTKELQKLIDSCSKDSLLIFEEGKYFITSLKFKSDLTIYLKKGATILGDPKLEDYEYIPEREVVDGVTKERGIWEGIPSKMCLSIINFFDCKNTSLIGEGTMMEELKWELGGLMLNIFLMLDLI